MPPIVRFYERGGPEVIKIEDIDVHRLAPARCRLLIADPDRFEEAKRFNVGGLNSSVLKPVVVGPSLWI
jgi:hypothetical protein